MLFDSHAHLDMLADDTEELCRILAGEFAHGLSAIVQVSTAPEIHSKLYSGLRTLNRNIYYACGLPHSYPDDTKVGLTKVTDIARSGQVCAIGEVGLDYSRGRDPDQEARQKKLFVEQMQIARSFGLPVIIHTRDAAADTLAVLDQYPEVTGVVHCFTGDAAFAAALVERGWLISISGIVTFSSAGDLRTVAASLPDTCLLIETDAPFLSPVPFRGQPNLPSRVIHTATVLATLRGVSLEDLAALTAENGRRLFGKNEAALPSPDL